MDSREDESLSALMLLLGIGLIIWLLAGFVVWAALPSWETRGQFGDMFGAINAFFSAAALASVVYAVFLQRRELALQREELEQTRKELRRSAEAQEKSQLALKDQVEALHLSARLSSISGLISAYGERARYCEDKGEFGKVVKCENRIEQLAHALERLLVKIDEESPSSSPQADG